MTHVFHTEIIEADSPKEAVEKAIAFSRTWLEENPEHREHHLGFEMMLTETNDGRTLATMAIGKEPARMVTMVMGKQESRLTAAFRSMFTLESLLRVVVIMIISGLIQHYFL